MPDTLEWKAQNQPEGSAEPFTFTSRVYRTNSDPDADLDVITDGAVKDGHEVVVSHGEHAYIKDDVDPAGTARLFHNGNAVIAVGQAYDTPLGKRLASTLKRQGHNAQWSIAWPNATLKWRAPTPAELAKWPDARRIITSWQPHEISPVAVGACGPSCRTLSTSKCAGKCECAKPSQPDPRPSDLRPGAPTGSQELLVERAARAGRHLFSVPLPTVRWFVPATGATKCGQALADYGEIWLSVALTKEELTTTLGHEWAHHEQFKNLNPSEGAAEVAGQYLTRMLRERYPEYLR